MKILITGICGFAGNAIARGLLESMPDCTIYGIDNLVRPGSELNRASLKKIGIQLFHGDLRVASDLDVLPPADWVIDAAANPSVLAGVQGYVSSRQLLEHNLFGTVQILEYCKKHHAGLILLSTSRVYSIHALTSIPLDIENEAFVPDTTTALQPGLSINGIDESFSTHAPLSLYGSSKLASEQLALEYSDAFGFPVWINRCGVMAGAGQFGRPDQGIYSFWIHSYARKKPLTYLGFGGKGYQVRDCLHPSDLVSLLVQQLKSEARRDIERIANVSGGMKSAISLSQLSAWCEARFGLHEIGSSNQDRQYDIPWIVLNPSKTRSLWDWEPIMSLFEIFEEIAEHTEHNPDWLEVSSPI